MEDEDFLADMEADNESEAVTQPEAVVEQPAEPVVVEPVAEVIPDVKPEPQHVPITALLDERDKRKGLEQELERLRAQQEPAHAPNARVVEGIGRIHHVCSKAAKGRTDLVSIAQVECRIANCLNAHRSPHP